MRILFALNGILILCCAVCITAQTDAKQFGKDGLSFEYLPGWTLYDDSNSDAQQITLVRADTSVQVRVFVQRRKTKTEKISQVRKSVIDPYVVATAKQFISMGAKPEQSPDSIDIGSMKAEGVNIKAVLGGEPGAARIYWAYIEQRLVMLTYFGPDKQMEKHMPLWDRVRTTLKVETKK